MSYRLGFKGRTVLEAGGQTENEENQGRFRGKADLASGVRVVGGHLRQCMLAGQP